MSVISYLMSLASLVNWIQSQCIFHMFCHLRPIHGANIVKTVLSDKELREQYYGECKKMANRIDEMRTDLVIKLKNAGSEHDWSHITNQIGMFAFTGMFIHRFC